EYVELPSTDAVTDLSSSITTTIVINTETVSLVNTTDDGRSEIESSADMKSVGRDFAPMFIILTILFILILLGLISTIYNQRDLLFRRSHRRNTDSIYSQLTSANEFDLN
ncbi:unnamed protein product, partial [Rotaria sp. Silwood2]